MLSHLLPLAVETIVENQAPTGITKIVSDFGLDWPMFLSQVVSFSIVAFILYKFAWKPVLATLDERQKKIEAGLKYAAEMQAQLQAANQESAAILKSAQVESSRIIDDARKTAKDFLDRQTKDASEKSAQILAKGQQAIELEHKKMIAEARQEIARLVVVTTQRVLAKELTEADKARYSDAATRELTSV